MFEAKPVKCADCGQIIGWSYVEVIGSIYCAKCKQSESC